MSMPNYSRPVSVFVSDAILAIGVGWFTPSAGAADQVKAGVAGRPNPRFAKDPPPTKKIVYKKVGERELSLHVFEPAAQDPTGCCWRASIMKICCEPGLLDSPGFRWM